MSSTFQLNMHRAIKIKKINLPKKGNIEDDIAFLCKSLGHSSNRDKNDTAAKIFRIIVQKGVAEDRGIKSEDIAKEIGVTRGAIVHHLNSFIKSGIIVKEKNTYRLRSQCLKKSIEEIKYDFERIFDELIKIAEDIDETLGYFYR